MPHVMSVKTIIVLTDNADMIDLLMVIQVEPIEAQNIDLHIVI